MQEYLFKDKNEKINYGDAVNGELVYYPNFFTIDQAASCYNSLLADIKWQQDQISIMGQKIDIPRLTSWYGIEGKTYTYSGIRMDPNAFNDTLKNIKKNIETVSHTKYNSVLLNQYRSGLDSVDWHSDDEKELDPKSQIASVSFGIDRDFQIKLKDKSSKLINISLKSGSLVVMKPPFQINYVHRIPKRIKLNGIRINLTFRVIT